MRALALVIVVGGCAMASATRPQAPVPTPQMAVPVEQTPEAGNVVVQNIEIRHQVLVGSAEHPLSSEDATRLAEEMCGGPARFSHRDAMLRQVFDCG